LPRIDLNKNINALGDVFPYEDLGGKNIRSNTRMKQNYMLNNMSGGMQQRGGGGSYQNLPLKDKSKSTTKGSKL